MCALLGPMLRDLPFGVDFFFGAITVHVVELVLMVHTSLALVDHRMV